MSQVMDERILSMKFDNKQFGRGIRDTIKDLTHLRKELDFKDAGSGLDEFGSKQQNRTLSSFANQIGNLTRSFSPLVSTLTTVANKLASIPDTIAATVKSLSSDQIGAGFSKYEQKTKSVKTIMAATGKSVTEVNDALERLMWFSDETSYSFTDMVDNIGKFTSQGVELDDAVQAMQGISTEAALAGQNTQAAARAMYNFSQALGTGSVKLMDWRSIENANLATAEFKENIIQTAIELGTLQKNGKTKKGTLVDKGTFGSTLNEGWFTSQVLLESLKKYGGYANKLYDYIETHDVDTASQAIKELGDAGDELGAKAFKAAQEARTLVDAIDATKDAVSSGWLRTFELVIGDTDEATELFTDMANALWEVFAASGETRNELLELWKENGGREDLLAGVYDILESIWNIIQDIKSAVFSMFPEVTVDNLLAVSSWVKDFGANLKESFGIIEDGLVVGLERKLVPLTGAAKEFTETLQNGSTGDSVKKLQERLERLGYTVGKAGADGIFGKDTESAIKKFQEDLKLDVTGIFDRNTSDKLMDSLFDAFTEPIEKGATGEAVKEFQEQLIEAGYSVGPAMADGIFGKDTEKALSEFQKVMGLDITGTFDKSTRDALYKALYGVKEVVEEERGPSSGSGLTRLRETLESITSFGVMAWHVISDLGKAVFRVLVQVHKAFDPIRELALDVFDAIGLFFAELSSNTSDMNLFSGAIVVALTAVNLFAKGIKFITDSLRAFIFGPDSIENASEHVLAFSNAVNSIKTTFENTKFGKGVKKVSESFKGLFSSLGKTSRFAGAFEVLKHGIETYGDGFLVNDELGRHAAQIMVEEFKKAIIENFGWLENTFVGKQVAKLHLSEIGSSLTEAYNSLKTAKIGEKLKTIWADFREQGIGYFGSEAGKESINGIVNDIKESFANAFSWVGELDTVKAIKAKFSELKAKLLAPFENLKAAYNSAVESGNKTAIWIKGKIDPIKGVWESIKQSFTSFGEIFTKGKLGRNLSLIWSNFKKNGFGYLTSKQGMADIQATFDQLKNSLSSWFNNLDIVKTIKEKFQAIKEKILAPFEGIKAAFNNLKDSGNTTALWIQEKIDGVKAKFESIKNAIKTFFSDILGLSSETAEDSSAEEVWSSIEKSQSWLWNIIDKIGSFFSSIFGKSDDVAGASEADTSITDEQNGLQSKMESFLSFIENVKNIWNTVKETISSWFGSIDGGDIAGQVDSKVQYFVSIISSIKAGISNIVSTISSFLGWLLGGSFGVFSGGASADSTPAQIPTRNANFSLNEELSKGLSVDGKIDTSSVVSDSSGVSAGSGSLIARKGVVAEKLETANSYITNDGANSSAVAEEITSSGSLIISIIDRIVSLFERIKESVSLLVDSIFGAKDVAKDVDSNGGVTFLDILDRIFTSENIGKMLNIAAALVGARTATETLSDALLNLSVGAQQIASGYRAVAKDRWKLLKIAALVVAITFFLKGAVEAIQALGSMDEASLTRGALVFAGILAGLGIIVFALSKFISMDAGITMAVTAAAMLGICASVGILVGAIQALAMMDVGTLAKGGLILVALMAGVLLFIKMLGNQVTVLSGLAGVAVAIGILAGIAYLLSGTNWDEMKTGLKTIGVIMLMMAAFIFVVSKLGVTVVKLTGIIGIAAAVAILAGVVVILGLIPSSVLKKGTLVLTALVAMLLALTAVAIVIKKTKTSIAPLIAIVAIIGVMALIMVGLSQIPTRGAWQAIAMLESITAAIVVISGMAMLANKFGGGTKGMIRGAAGIGVAFAVVSAILLAVIGGLGELDNAMKENSGRSLADRIRSGGEVLGSLRDAFNRLGTPLELACTAAGILLASEVISHIPGGELGAITGAAAITTALSIVGIVTAGVLTGIGYMNVKMAEWTGATASAYINSAAELLETISDCLGRLGTPLEVAVGAASLLLSAEILGRIPKGISSLFLGSLAIPTAFAIIGGVTAAVLGGIGAMNTKLAEWTGTSITEHVNSGGEILSAIGNSIGTLGDPLSIAIGATALLISSEVLGQIPKGVSSLLIGSFGIPTAFAIIGGITAAALGGIGAMNTKLAEWTGTSLVDYIGEGGSVLTAIGDALGQLGDPLPVAIGAAVLLGSAEVIGQVPNGVGALFTGSIAIPTAFGIVAGLTSAVLSGLGVLNTKLAEWTGTSLVDYIGEGGTVLAAIADAFSAFGSDTLSNTLSAVLLLGAAELIGMIPGGGLALLAGSVAIPAAFGVIVGLTSAVLAGLGKIDELTERWTGKSLSDRITEGSEVLGAIGASFGVFAGAFKVAYDSISGVNAETEGDIKEGQIDSIKALANSGLTGDDLTTSLGFMEQVATSMNTMSGLPNIDKIDEGISSWFGEDTVFNTVLKGIGDMADVFSEEGLSSKLTTAGSIASQHTTNVTNALAFMEIIAKSMDKMSALEHIDRIDEGFSALFGEDTVFNTVLTGIGDMGSLFSSNGLGIKLMTAGRIGRTHKKNIESALEFMEVIAGSMDKMGALEHVDRIDEGFSALFGEDTVFNTVLTAISDVTDLFSEKGLTTKILTMGVNAFILKAPLKVVLGMMEQLAGFMDTVSGYKNLERKPGVFASIWNGLFGESSAFSTVLDGLSQIVDEFAGTDEQINKILSLKDISDSLRTSMSPIFLFLTSLASFMNGITSLENLERDPGLFLAIWKGLYGEKSAFSTVLNGLDTIVDEFAGSEEQINKILSLKDTAEAINDSIDPIFTLLTTTAGFMNAVAGLENLERDQNGVRQIWNNLFGEETAFGTVLSAAEGAITKFQSLEGVMSTMTIDASFVGKFSRITGMLHGVIGVLESVASVTYSGDSLTYLEIFSLIDSLTTQIEDFSYIVNNENYSAYVDTVTAVAGAYGEIVSAISEIMKYVEGRNVLTDVTSFAQSIISSLTSSDVDVPDASVLQPLTSGLTGDNSTLLSSANAIPNAIISAFNGKYSSFVTSGKNAVLGYAAGLRYSAPAIAAAEALARETIEAIKNYNDEGSPSRLYEQSGMYAVQGYANGLQTYSYVAEKAAEGVADDSFRTIQNGIAVVSSALANGIDTTPTIRPVLDLSDVSSGAASINGLFGDRRLKVSTSAGIAKSVSGYSRDGSMGVDNFEVVSAIQKLREDVTSFRDGLGDLTVVTETGALVAAIGPKMDSYLGRRALREKRRG